VTTGNGTRTLAMVAPRLEIDAQANAVHTVVVAALEALAGCMREIRRALPDAVRGESITYIYEFNPEL
jgi:hypothetical protein